MVKPKTDLWAADTLYCFVTLYPFTESFINVIRTIRSKLISHAASKVPTETIRTRRVEQSRGLDITQLKSPFTEVKLRVLNW